MTRSTRLMFGRIVWIALLLVSLGTGVTTRPCPSAALWQPPEDTAGTVDASPTPEASPTAEWTS